MESNTRGKRKSPCTDFIFELNEVDMSAEELECPEPDMKIPKIDTKCPQIENLEHNLQLDTEILTKSPNSDVQKPLVQLEVMCKQSVELDLVETPQNDLVQNAIKDENEEAKSDSLNLNTTDLTEQISANTTEQSMLEDGELLDDKSVVVSVEPNTDANFLENIVSDDDSQPKLDKENAISDHTDGKKPDEEDSFICISFSDDNLADLYKLRFLKFIQTFIELDVVSQDKLCIKIRRDLNLNPAEWVVLDETAGLGEDSSNESPSPSKKRKKKPKTRKELFVVDPNPSDATLAQDTKYSSKFSINNCEKSEKISVSTQTCFNCGKNHALRDCPEPKNFDKINAARQKFQNNKMKNARYHLEEDQKYSHLAPGKISNNLREALGIRDGQLAPFIYQMRRLGYPPGWLEEAKFVSSNLTMFGMDGKDVQNNANHKQGGLDVDKIIDYPGFNVPMEQGLKDEFMLYRTPPYSELCSKLAMITYFEKQVQINPVCHTEIEPVNGEAKSPFTPDVDSSSLLDLEKQKEHLLAALNDDEDPIPETKIVESSLDDSLVPLSSVLLLEDDLDVSGSPILNNSVKNSSFGTPILKSSSPYSCLPNPDNFSKDVSPMINFENLPNSTGKYEQMTNVLQKVRNTLKHLPNCNS